MAAAIDSLGCTTTSDALTVRLPALDEPTELGRGFGRELHDRAMLLPPGCMTRVAIEEN
jgi:hypothetical protein